MKRLFDLILSTISLLLLLPILIIVGLLIAATSKGTILYWSERVGINNNNFRMPKFRSMKINTPAVATHKLKNVNDVLTPIGGFIRKYSLDELPQLWSIIMGDMSIVGPRPALFNQSDLIALRTHKGIHKITPGLTGWAQINGRDELPILQKIEFDFEYLQKQSFIFDLKIIWLTFYKVIRNDDVLH